jgi:hypothetical protein
MKYLILAYGDESKMASLTKDDIDGIIRDTSRYDEELKQTGHHLWGMSLGWGSTILRLRDGKLTITDGPYAATKEVVGGLVLIEARDLNEAIQVASLHPAARMGEQWGWGIELRPLEELPLCKEQPSA